MRRLLVLIACCVVGLAAAQRSANAPSPFLLLFAADEDGSKDGVLLRQASAAASDFGAPVRPYAFAYLPDLDRIVVTSAAMMEETTAHVVQIFRYSDFALLKTLPLPVGRLKNGTEVPGSEKMGFGPRVLPDGSVFFNAYGCASIGSPTSPPRLRGWKR